MTQKELWTIIKARKFFPAYAPEVKNFYRKSMGVNTRNNPAEFTAQEKQMIREGLKKMFAEVKKVKL